MNATSNSSLTPLTTRSGSTLILPVLCGTVFWLVAATGDPLQGVAAYLVLWFVGGVGLRILQFGRLIPLISPDLWLWRLGPGVVIGVLSLYMIRIASSHDAFVTLLVVFCLLDLLRFARSKSFSLASESAKHLFSSEFLILLRHSILFAIAIGMSLSKTWSWVLPTVGGLSFALAATFLKVTHTLRFLSLLLLLVCSAALMFRFASDTRSELWWMLADDFQWFESRSWSMIRFGPQVEPTSLARPGVSTVAYHHGAYFLSGLVDLGIRGGAYVALTKCLPILLVASVSASLLALFRTLRWTSSLEGRWLLPILAAVLFLVPITPESPSNTLGFAAIIASASIAVVANRNVTTWTGALVCSLFIPATVLGKAPFVYASVMIVGIVLLGGPFRNAKLIVANSVLGVALFVFLSSGSLQSRDFRFSFFDSASLFELASGSFLVRGLAIVSVVAAVAPGYLFAGWMMCQTNLTVPKSLLLGLLATMTVGIVLRFTVGGQIETIRYLWLPALVAHAIATALAAGLILMKSERLALDPKTIVGASFIGAFLLMLLPRVMPNLNSGSTVAKTFRFFRSPDSVQLLATLISALVVFRLAYEGRRSKLQKSKILIRETSLLAGLVAVTLLVCGANQVSDLSQNFEESRSGVSDEVRRPWIGSPELIEASRFLALHTTASSVIGVTLCSPEASECRPNEHSFAAYSRRRFLSLDPFWPAGGLEAEDTFNSRLTPEKSLLEILNYWKKRGVNYGVVDKSIATDENRLVAIAGNKIVYENTKYQIIEL